jgi:hypothetical protein
MTVPGRGILAGLLGLVALGAARTAEPQEPCAVSVPPGGQTYAERAVVPNGEPFTNVWRFEKTGACSGWRDYRLVWQRGRLPGASPVIEIDDNGQASVTLVAPAAPTGTSCIPRAARWSARRGSPSP